MEEGKAEFANFGSRAFFERCSPSPWRASSPIPIYGGNRDKASWKMLGFPGLPATYADKFDDYRNKRYIGAAAIDRGLFVREATMATRLKEVDAVMVGMGWTGAILARELTKAGL